MSVTVIRFQDRFTFINVHRRTGGFITFILKFDKKCKTKKLSEFGTKKSKYRYFFFGNGTRLVSSLWGIVSLSPIKSIYDDFSVQPT